MGQPAARVGDMHVCPMFDGPKPHVGGPVLPPGKITVLIGGMPAATITDRCVCASAPDIIMQGAQTVLINNMMAARMGDATVHGGRIVIGCPTVLIGGPTFTDNSLLRFRPEDEEDESPSLIGTLLKAIIVIVAAGVAIFASGVAAGIAEIVNWGIGIYEAISGKDFITGQKLEPWERALAITPLGAAGRKVAKGAVIGVRNVFKGAKAVENVEDVAKLSRIAKLSGDVERVARREQRVKKIYELREKRARMFYEKHRPDLTPKEVNSHINGIDLNQRVKIIKVSPDKTLSRYMKTSDGKIVDRGEYFTPNSKASPDELGIGNYYEDANGQINMRIDKQTGNLDKSVDGLESTAKPINDNFSVKGMDQPTSGGAQQIYIPYTQGHVFTPVR